MGYVLSASELANFSDLVDWIRGTKVPPTSMGSASDYLGKYYLAYQFLVDAQSTETGGVSAPKASTDINVWLWMRGATMVNQDAGAFSNFIRAYTAEQYQLRTGQTPDSNFIQTASNAIANAIFDDVLTGGVIPDISRIGSVDAGQTIGSLYGDSSDAASWSGVPLFMFFGIPDYFNQSVLDEKNGTYDLLALVKSGVVATGVAEHSSFVELANAFLNALQATTANTSGFSLTTSTMVQAFNNAWQYVLSRFADLPDSSSLLLTSEITLGKLSAADVLAGTNDADFINSGGGNDTVIGSIDSDLLDGGDGIDTLDYSSEPGIALNVTLKNSTNGTLTEIIDKGEKGIDRAIDFEILKLSGSSDSLKIDAGADLTGIREIDAGDNPAGSFDTLDLSAYGGKVHLDHGHLIANGIDIEIKNFEDIKLTSQGDDINITTSSIEKVEAGGGNDTVRSTDIGVTIDLGAGDDVLKQSGPGTIVYTGAGQDTVEISHSGQMDITDASTSDRLTYNGYTLTGGIRNPYSENPYVVDRSGLRYGRNQLGQLVITDRSGNETFIDNFNFALTGAENRTAGIYVLEMTISYENLFTSKLNAGWWDATWNNILCQASIALNGFSMTGRSDPLVLDLDGDGLELSSRVSGNALFDTDNDGFAEQVGWARGGDGILVRDLNSNGVIDNGTEMFGNKTQTGFQQLALLDGNSDGKVDAGDNGLADFNGDGVVDSSDTFDKLQVWVDTNENGVTDAGELHSLSSLEIQSISSEATATNTDVSGNTVDAVASYTKTDGSTGTIGNVNLDTDEFDTKWLGDSSVSVEAALRPDLKGYGTLTSLHVAMTLDPTLIAVVDSVLPTLNSINLEDLRAAAGPLLAAWVDAVPVPAGTPGTQGEQGFPFVTVSIDNVDTVVDFAVAITDEDGTYWGYASGATVYDGAGIAIDRPTRAQVLASTPAQGQWSGLSDIEVAFLDRHLGMELPFGSTLNAGSAAISGMNDMLTYAWHELNETVIRLAAQGPLSSFFAGVQFDASSDTFKPTTDHGIEPMLESIISSAPTDAAAAEGYLGDWKDILDVMLPDFERPGGVNLKVTYAYLFQNLVGAYENVSTSLSLIQLAGMLEIPIDTIKTGAGAVNGSSGLDLFYLDSSDQTLTGGAGEDAYVVGKDFGHDTIQDIYESIGDGQEDSLRFAQLNATDLAFSRDGNDLIIDQVGTANEIKVVDEFAGRRPGLIGYIDFDKSIEVITFADGSVWDKYDIAYAVGHISKPTDDNLIGTPDQDVLNGGAGTDFMSGGDDGDTYLFGLGDGHDTIRDGLTYVLNDNPDTVRFGAGITRDAVTFSRDGDSSDLEISVNGTDDALTVAGQFDYSYNVINFAKDRIETFAFADGDYVNWEDIIKQLDAFAGTDGNDQIYGFAYEDVLDGGKGDDYLSGGNEDDTYIFGKGYGHDRINDLNNNILSGQVDTIRFNADVTPDDVVFSRNADSDDLLITLSSGDTLLVQQQFDRGGGIYTWSSRIEQFVFNDGTVFTSDDIFQKLITQSETSGNDAIYGFDRDDILEGGAGDDYLAGGIDDDTYVWNQGDGNDTITELGSGFGGTDDKLVLHGVNPADVGFTHSGDDITLMFAESSPGAGDGGSVLLKGEGYSSLGQGVEQIVFDDGTVWTTADVGEKALAASSTSANDVITGFSLADTLEGGLGDDTLNGGVGNDTYVYTRGDGNDSITELGTTAGPTSDKLVLHGIDPADVSITRSGGDVTLIIAESSPGAGDAGSVILRNEIDSFYGQGVEQILFDDGTIWVPDDLRRLALGSTPGDDVITGSNVADTLEGGLGNDTLNGGLGNDTYIYARGDGNDTITELGSGSGGTDDRLVLHGVNPADVSFTYTGDDIKLVFAESSPGAGDSGSILLKGEGYTRFGQGVEQVVFDDGTVWTPPDLGAKALAAVSTSGNDVITGFSMADTLEGGLGDDTVNGGLGNDTYIYTRGDGNDSITELGNSGGSATDKLVVHGVDPADVSFTHSGDDIKLVFAESSPGAGDAGSILLKGEGYTSFDQGVEQVVFDDGTVWTPADLKAKALAAVSTSGNDVITGFSMADTLEGGLGDDTLSGGPGNDTYIYALGDGNDSITELTSGGTSDALVLQNIDPDDVTVIRDGFDISLGIAGGGSILLKNELNNSLGQGVERITFADGTVWQLADILAQPIVFDDVNGDGTVSGSTASDAMVIKGIGKIFQGGTGSDSYSYANGAGSGVIRENGSSSDTDTLQFTDLNAADLTFTRSIADTNDVKIIVNATGDTITIDNQMVNAASGLEQIKFADGTTWDANTLAVNSRRFVGTSAGETINGTTGNDTIYGNGGNDTLHGLGGNDTYIYALGDGSDLIQENGSSSDTDTLQFVDLNAPNVTFASSATDANDVKITVNSTGDVITIDNQLVSTAAGIEQVKFADGAIWTRQNILDATKTFNWSGSTTNTLMEGNDFGKNVFTFGAGMESAIGGDRKNVYQVSTATGQATIELSAASGSENEIDFGSGITDNNLWFEQLGNDLKIDLLGTSTSVSVTDWFTPASSALQEITAGGLKLDSQISQLVQAMATYSEDNPGFDPTSSSNLTMPTDTSLQNSLAAAWHA